MSKQILILSGSPRAEGNSDILCDAFREGAVQGGHQVEKIRICEKRIGYCTACYACKASGGVCAIDDDMSEILEKMHQADVIVLSSPVYFYSINGQMKTFIDRCVAQWRQIRDKEFYYIMTAADHEESAMDCTLECFRGLAVCLGGSKEMGVVHGTGVYEPGTVRETPAMELAMSMGRNA